MSGRGRTPSQTVGPYFAVGLTNERWPQVVSRDHPRAIRIRGRIVDGAGDPVPDAMVEIWQANEHGRYAHPADAREELPLEEGFTGFGRCGTDGDGEFELVTVKPGPVPAPGGGMQAPHVEVSVFARGLLKRLVTRMYFPDEEGANAVDPVLALVPAEERPTLVAVPDGDALRFDIHLQGDRQTAFFAL
ncbi:MAG TPA: protocatechuate 3,4-dioxygenase subunit alpha [Gaiellaceae bacterium]|nr:protocatechuate 3,4-dioxygenase subunit alpha [Gaiellaceae bacterium]